jgi:radical SAM protein with 4Fe4S-binding SPASM domain
MFPHSHNYLKMLDFVRSNYFSKGPAYVDIEVSNRCNLRCKMCWFHGENGIGDRYRNLEMGTEEILELINQLAVYRPHIYFGGGEPFIREDFLTIMAQVKSFGLPISFTTNGTLLDQERIQKVAELRVDHINFSIDGPEELHDKLRGQGNFRKLLATIQFLLECKKAININKPLITVNITINPLVVGHLKETVNLIRKMTNDKVDFFRIHHLWFITPRELEFHKEAISKSFGISAFGAGAHCLSLSQHIDSISVMTEISQLKIEEKVKSFPNLQDKEIHQFYSERYRLRKRCIAPFHAILVKPNGDLKFCPDEWIDDYVLGNIRDDCFENIWNNNKARHFRSVIFWKKSFPGCKRCSWMHCF